MPLTLDSILQTATGSITTTTANQAVAVTLPAGTTAGTSVIVVIVAGTVTQPAGFIQDHQFTSAFVPTINVYRKPGVAAGESSWSWTIPTSGTGGEWWVAEVDGLDLVQPFEGFLVGGSSAVAASASVTLSSGNYSPSNGMDTIALAIMADSTRSTTAAGSWDTASFTGGFVSQGQVQQANKSGLAVAANVSGGASLGPYATSATYTAPAGSTNDFVNVWTIGYRSATSSTVDPLFMLCGFEHGHAYGGANTAVATRPFDTTGTPGTDILVQAASARSAPSSYGCRIISAAANRNIIIGQVNQYQTLTPDPAVIGFDVRVVSGTGTIVVADMVESGSGSDLQLVYDVTGTRFGIRWGAAGTVTWQAGTTALNTWTWVTIRTSGTTSATRTADWQIETGAGVYTAQTSLSSTETAGGGIARMSFGGPNSGTQTSTIDVDNIAMSLFYSAFPMPPHTIRLLKVDPAGTPTVNGTVGNFALVTNNATGAALTSGTLAAARDAVDEGPPPTISTASDGVVQTTTANTDYIQFPMDTFTIGAASVVAGVRIYACMISTTGAGAGALSIHGWDGTGEVTPLGMTVAAATYGNATTLSSTNPPWQAGGVWTPTRKVWTQAVLDAAAVRVGYSGDATPDMGVHVIYLEVATRPAVRARQVSAEDDAFTVDLLLSPYSSASLAYEVTSNDAGRGVTFAYSLAGIPQTPVYVAPSSTSTVTVTVDNFGDVSDVTLTPDAVT